MTDALGSSHFTLILEMGIGAYIGLLHVFLWRQGRGEAAHLWVAGWCLGSVAFQLARYVQLHTDDASTAVLATRLAVATTPWLVCALVGFGRALSPRPWPTAERLVLGLGTLALSLAFCATPLVIPGATAVRRDWFGHEHIAVPASGWLLLLLAVALAAFISVARDVLRTPQLEVWERRVLLASLSIYVALGITSLLSGMGVLPFPVLFDHAPVVIALGLNYLLVHRHRRLQTELQRMVDESEARYRRLVESAPLGVIACDLEGWIVAVNRPVLAMLGSPSADRTREFNLLKYPPLVDAGAAELFRDCITSEKSVVGEMTYVSHWGRASDYRLHVAPLRDARGRLIGAQALVEDVGERRRLEVRLRQSKKLEAVGRLAAGIAHEINNPIAYVCSNLRMLRSEWDAVQTYAAHARLPGELRDLFRECEELIDESREGVDRIVSIVREFRDFSRVGDDEGGPIDLNEVIEDALRTADPHRHPDVRLERNLAELPPTVGSPGQLHQVVLNLVVNALQAVGERGRVCVSSRADDGLVRVRVEDDGPGIALDVQERLFEPFFTTKPADEGTGLGLYICYEIVHSHGGVIRVEPRPGRGAAFEVQLPAAARKPKV